MCRKMKWDYYTYMRQPQWFLDALRAVDNVEAMNNERMARQAKRKQR